MYLPSRFCARLCTDESGATAIEYGLLAALIALMITASVSLLGGSIEATFGTLAAELADDAPDAEPEVAVADDRSEREEAAAAIAEAHNSSESLKAAETKKQAKIEEAEVHKAEEKRAEAERAEAQKAGPELKSPKKLGSQSETRAINRTDRTGF